MISGGAYATIDDPLRGQSALVAGGSRGIGLAIAQALDRRGCRVMLASRAAGTVREAEKSLRLGRGFAPCDVRSAKDVDDAFAAAEAAFGPVNIAVNSAGIGRSERSQRKIADPVASLPEDEWDDVLDTNLRGMFHFARRAAQSMSPRRQGQIVNISSARGARKGQAFGAAYCAAKSAARAMFESLAAELAPLGIRAFSLLPDAVDTGLIAHTRLAHRGAMSADTLANLIADLLALPFDVGFEDPLASPLRAKLGLAIASGAAHNEGIA